MTVCLLRSSNKLELTEVQFFSSGYPAMNETRFSDGVDTIGLLIVITRIGESICE